MTIWRFRGCQPKIGKNVFIAPSADVIGDVTIEDDCYIGFGCRLRGDFGSIHIGKGTTIQENVVIHTKPEETVEIGENVTIGHGSVLHGCSIGNFALIGIRSIISDFAAVGEWAVIGEGSLVRRKQIVSARSIAVGSPVRIIGTIDDRKPVKMEMEETKKHYRDLLECLNSNDCLEKI